MFARMVDNSNNNDYITTFVCTINLATKPFKGALQISIKTCIVGRPFYLQGPLCPLEYSTDYYITDAN